MVLSAAYAQPDLDIRLPGKDICSRGSFAESGAVIRVEAMGLEAGMIVCFCREIPQTAIDAALADGARTIAEIFRACAQTPNCGGCLPSIRARSQSFKPNSSNAKKRRSSVG